MVTRLPTRSGQAGAEGNGEQRRMAGGRAKARRYVGLGAQVRDDAHGGDVEGHRLAVEVSSIGRGTPAHPKTNFVSNETPCFFNKATNSSSKLLFLWCTS